MSFIIGLVVGLFVGWIVPAPEKVRDVIDSVLERFTK